MANRSMRSYPAKNGTVDTPTPSPRWVWGVTLLATAVGPFVWLNSLRGVELQDTSDVGLIAALPWWTALGPLLLIIAFLWTLWRLNPSPARTRLLVVQTIVLIAMLFGTGPILEPVTANHVAWRHVGIAEAINNNGIDGTVDAYFNWPGFFAMVAIVVEAAGPLATLKAAAWMPVALNALYVIPVFFLAKWLIRSETSAWVAVWIFLLGNWVGQDYLSPQGFAYLGYLVIIVLLATSITGSSDTEAEPSDSGLTQMEPMTSKPIAVGMVILIFGWIVVSHQLTPFAVLLVIGTLLITGRPIPWQLITVMLLMQVAWFSFLAVDYLRGNLQVLVDQLGDIDQITRSNISDRVAGSAGHVLVVRLRMLTVVVLTMGASLGWLIQRAGASKPRRRQLLTVALIGAAPFGLLVLGSYGGEIALRAYLFALPVLAIYSAAALTISPPEEPNEILVRPRMSTVAPITVALVVLLAAFPLTRYGNEDSLYFSLEEAAAIEMFYEVAPPGSLVVAAIPNLPWKSRGYTDYEYRTLSRMSPVPASNTLLDHIRNLAASHENSRAYVLLTRSQGAFNDSFGVWESGAIEELASRLRAAEDFVVIYDSDDGTLFQHVR